MLDFLIPMAVLVLATYKSLVKFYLSCQFILTI